uniref:CX domain-containing protein n=1 Tax=Steinernema glaseri TaxID=37863 RepID=A0A1I7YY01_9BILA
MEIALQGQSNGILYKGYSKEFIECVFEDGSISGRNERYEFRCDADLACCGRQCCIPQEATIPFWLMIILIVLALLLLLAILGALAWMFAKRKPKPEKPKKAYGPGGGFRVMRQIGDDHHVLAGGVSDSYSSRGDNYSTLNRPTGTMTGYGNRAYNAYDKTPDYDLGPSTNTAGAHRISSQDGDHMRREEELTPFQGRQYSQSTVEGEFPPPPPPMTAQRGYYAPGRVHETFEESFKEEIQMERPDSREFL